MTHVELLDPDTTPQRLLILGGGYIALELAQAMARLGAHVTVCEKAERLLKREDPDIAAAVTAALTAEEVIIITGADVGRVSGRSGERVALHGTVGGAAGQVIEGSHLLVALGKEPNTKGIGLDTAGVAVTPAGYVEVNDRLETTAPNVWAMGDCAGSPAFTHMAFEDYPTVRDNLAGKNRKTTGRQVPNGLFIEPELARVGLNEIEARQAGVAYRLAELPVAAIMRVRTTGEQAGKLKALVAADDRILGFTALATSGRRIAASGPARNGSRPAVPASGSAHNLASNLFRGSRRPVRERTERLTVWIGARISDRPRQRRSRARCDRPSSCHGPPCQPMLTSKEYGTSNSTGYNNHIVPGH